MMRIGVLFGGQSREREVSFAGGRTVYDNLNKTLFEPVPIFIDSLGHMVLLNWENIYKGTIRDFYPAPAFQPFGKDNAHAFQYYIESLADKPREMLDQIMASAGRKIEPSELPSIIDFAFLCLHGPYGEDGNIQGLLEWYGVPYSGSGILPSAIGIDKMVQKDLMASFGFPRPKSLVLTRESWFSHTKKDSLLNELMVQLGNPLVVKAPRQGSSIGISILEDRDLDKFEQAVNKAFFVDVIRKSAWQKMTIEEKHRYLLVMADIRTGIGFPVIITPGRDGAISPAFAEEHGSEHAGLITLYRPEDLWKFLDSNNYTGSVMLESPDGEETILFEQFIRGKEFSAIVVVGEDGQPLSLPPTQIIKAGNMFDYRSKYLPGMSRKVTPIDVPDNQLDLIKRRCVDLFRHMHFDVYARIDGFITDKGEVFLNDPNTTSGMMPSSFFFHQAAEIGLNPSQFLTYIIRTSLKERTKSGKRLPRLLKTLAGLDARIAAMHEGKTSKTRVAVVMGGYSAERHISVESGRNIYEKLASSTKYEPVPVFLTGGPDAHELYLLPINILLKDNADDIKEKVIGKGHVHPALQQIREEADDLTKKYAGHAIQKPQKISYKELGRLVDFVFIALHGRPGEDGDIQKHLEEHNLPYNGSGIESSKISINKFETNELLMQNGLHVAKHTLVHKKDWERDKEALLTKLETDFPYPIIAKPVDDGCSAAVKKIKIREELEDFAEAIFRTGEQVSNELRHKLHLQRNEEFPIKTQFLVEELIDRNNASHFLEITGGLLTRYLSNNSGVKKLAYDVFEPSEALATGEVLSLEEKFLAGEGQNITPARFSSDPVLQKKISEQVRADLEKVARLVKVEGYCRTDAFVRISEDGTAETIIVEVNSLPGMTPATVIFHQAALNGLKPYDFIDAIIQFGIQRKLNASA